MADTNTHTNPPAVTPEASSIAGTRLAALQANIGRLSLQKQVGLLLAIAASVALVVGVVMWALAPTYQVMYGAVTGEEKGEIVAALQKANIEYRLAENTGAIMVPASKVHEVRLQLAMEGLPRSADTGFELLEQNPGFGASEFLEKARYQRALEGELARTIGTLNNVRNARVHLALPKQSVFIRNRQAPSASVVLDLYAGRALDPGQVAAITHLVSSSIPNLESSGVTLVDQRGNLLTRQDRSQSLGMTEGQFEYTRRLEEKYIRRIQHILAPMIGSDKARAQVVAEVDFTVTEQTQEYYNPESAALRSEQMSEEERTGSRFPQGIPGALSNQPPAEAQAPEVVPEANDDEAPIEAVPTTRSQRATRNYELDRTISHSRLSPGSIRRLSVAVLVDEKAVADAEGTVSTVPRSPQELAQVTALVKEAVGFNAERGDTINVINAPFVPANEEESFPEPSLWQQDWFWQAVKQGGGVLAILLLLLGVLRPAFRRLTALPESVTLPAIPNKDEEKSDDGLQEDQLSLSSNKPTLRLAGPHSLEANLEIVRDMATGDSRRVAQVVKNWLVSDG
ncbi:flagellar basal-body MS-ring/collar protein FliF [Nitrosococcus watsonii]|uniref:Flagellar M-ring protein n=1 Tax=Nitrosococcus watsoni (strain C-113) TaxID=105559 RepID=D8K8B7_NITWC|nr:flagellar basal-body MS-ring/collar protein FliF [Nitrosococcus watsonii]ADJ29037.1 flagellar M-ring protein FliF [Nitrosococcus watsonii C-113]